MLIFLITLLKNLEATMLQELQFSQNTFTSGQSQIFYNLESKYFIGTSKNISTNTETNNLLLYSTPLYNNLTVFELIYIPNINPPPIRIYYGIFQGMGEVYIYGGVSEVKVYNDFWRYDIKTGVWADISHLISKFNLPPLYEFGYTSFENKYIKHNKTYNFIMIAGGIDDKRNFIDKVWVLLFNERIDEKIFQDEDFTSIINCTGGPLAGLKIIDNWSNFLYFVSGYRKQNDNEKAYYVFDGICEMRLGNGGYIDIHKDFKVFKLSPKPARLFSGYSGYEDTVFQYFGIEYINNEFVYNTAVYSLKHSEREKGWKLYKNLDIRAHSFSIVRQNTDNLYLVEGDTSVSYQINYPEMNSLSVLKPTLSSLNEFKLVRLGNELYFYNTSLFKIQLQEKDQTSSVLVEEIKSLDIGPNPYNYLYSSEGDYLLITDWVIKPLLNYYLKLNIFNIRSKVWLYYTLSNYRPYIMDSTCALLKHPFILLVGNFTKIYSLTWNYNILVFNTITQKHMVHNLNYDKDKGSLSFACQVLNTYQNTSSIIPSNIIELVVVSKFKKKRDEFYKIQKIIVSETEIIQSDYIENLNEIHVPSYDYFFLENDEIYFFDYNPSKINNRSEWWQSKNSTFTKGEGRGVHYVYVSTNESSIEVLNNSLFVVSGYQHEQIRELKENSSYFYQIKLNKKSYIRSCDYGYKKVNGYCQPCELGTYNDNKAKGVCAPCNTFLNTTSGIGSQSISQCTNLLIYAFENEEDLIKKAFGVNESESPTIDDNYSDFKSKLAITFIVTLIAGLVVPLQLALVKFDYFQLNLVKKTKRKYKVERLSKKLAYYNNENQSNESWVNHKRTNINGKIGIIKSKIENNINIEKHFKIKCILTFLVVMITVLMGSALFISIYYKGEVKTERILISDYENEHEKLEDTIKVHIGIFPVNQKLCDTEFKLITGSVGKNDTNTKNLESKSYYLETDRGGVCIINLIVNFTVCGEKFKGNFELLSRRIYAKNLFFYAQSYSRKLKSPFSVFKTLQSNEGKSFAFNTIVDLTLGQKVFMEDYYFTSYTLEYSLIDEYSFKIHTDSISDNYLPLGSTMKFGIIIDWNKTAEVKTVRLFSSPDIRIALLLIAIVLIHEGLRYCGLRVLNCLENSK